MHDRPRNDSGPRSNEDWYGNVFFNIFIVMLDVEVCIYFALLVVWRAMNGMIEYDSI